MPIAQPIDFAGILFGGTQQIRQILLEKVKGMCTKRKLRPHDMDEICGLGQSYPTRNNGTLTLPSFQDCVANPDLLDGFTFGLIAGTLDISFDNIVKLDSKIQEYIDEYGSDSIVKEMNANGFKIASACGGTSREQIPQIAEIKAYVACRLTMQLDSPSV